MLLWDGLGVIGLALLGLWLFALVDCISTDASRCRNLPKLLWVIVVLIVPLGSVLWLMLGRPLRVSRTPGGTDYTQPRRPIAIEDAPRYSSTPAVTDRRSAELDREIEAWEARQLEREERERKLTEE
ncbi:MAG: hypothetical protein QOI55_498 [Actinomycetota bacterium]|jgi:hypothetical protein|nr:hypothetical protein [Actinomycetota bacterium]